MFRKILVPVDFTQKNLSAIRAALRIASDSQGQVTLLHVIERVEYLSPRELKGFYQSLEQKAESKMRALAKKFRKQEKRLKEEIIYGKRASEIVRYARKNRIQLIVVSSHRINPEAPRQELATVSYQIAFLSPCAVLLVK
jgi:nucleotide-binding universal stress UspA family protein